MHNKSKVFISYLYIYVSIPLSHHLTMEEEAPDQESEFCLTVQISADGTKVKVIMLPKLDLRGTFLIRDWHAGNVDQAASVCAESLPD